MATVAPAIANLETFGDNVRIFTWTPLTTTNADGGAIEMPGWADRTMQLTGTFGAGGTVLWQGSLFPSPTAGTDDDWFTLTDPQGNAISKTAAGGESILELVRWIRPKVSAGDGSTSITARLLVRHV